MLRSSCVASTSYVGVRKTALDQHWGADETLSCNRTAYAIYIARLFLTQGRLRWQCNIYCLRFNKVVILQMLSLFVKASSRFLYLVTPLLILILIRCANVVNILWSPYFNVVCEMLYDGAVAKPLLCSPISWVRQATENEKPSSQVRTINKTPKCLFETGNQLEFSDQITIYLPDALRTFHVFS